MSESNWEVIAEVNGELSAEILSGLIEAQGIPVWMSQEGAGKVYGLTLPALGKVQLLVPANLVNRALKIMDDYYAGKYALDDEEEVEGDGSQPDDDHPDLLDEA